MMPLEIAIEKITLSPAKKIGLKSRGEIVEGNYADLVLLSKEQDNQFEIAHVFVNGSHVVKNGEFEKKLAGTVLKK
jgi:alpha-D-ribose 1-methylphosphonate 5-triphosphate diphosphatase PhnM